MLSFVICDEDKNFTKIIKMEIDRIMMNYDIDYNIKIFYSYSKEWQKFIRKDHSFKIHILDYETSSNNILSGIKAIKYIREELDDWQSMIIVLGIYNKHRLDVINSRLLVIDFIYKLENFFNKFDEAVLIALKNYDKRPKVIKYSYKNVIYNIELRKIIYIEKEFDSKRCLIKTTSAEEYYYPGSLTNIIKLLDDRFIKCNRSTLINKEQIEKYISKSNTLLFKNKEKIDSISRDRKKDIIRCLRGL